LSRVQFEIPHQVGSVGGKRLRRWLHVNSHDDRTVDAVALVRLKVEARGVDFPSHLPDGYQ
jgi:hypothetical protein